MAAHQRQHHQHRSQTSSGAHTPSSSSSGAQTPTSPSMSSSMVSTMWSGFMRHLSGVDSLPSGASEPTSRDASPSKRRLAHASTEPLPLDHGHSHGHGQARLAPNDGINDVFVPPTVKRVASPFRPPPLDPVVLHGYSDGTPDSVRLLSAAVAEEIRIMLPERLRIAEDWRLVYSLEQDGASLTTLYQKAADVHGRRIGFILVVRDDAGGTFGAYLSEYPRPAPGYFGNGECFLWRASLLAGLPLPPSADTSDMNVGRTSTIASPNRSSLGGGEALPDLLSGSPPRDTSSTAAREGQGGSLLEEAVTEPPAATDSPSKTGNGTARKPDEPPPAAPESIRFKAFPYSGVNEYYINCETGFLSMGAGDGHYGLWLDNSLDRGRSGRSQTFGNEPLSDEGEKFGVLGVELWVLGA